MDYYIDFDNTLYNTPLLTKKMLSTLVESACAQKKLDATELKNECNLMFNREHIYNIYKLVSYFAQKYELDKSKIVKSIDNEILNGKNFVYDDSISFLSNLRKNNNKVFLLSYSNDNLNYQTEKILGSGLTPYFDALFITSKPKYELDINYSNGIFVDDNPKDLLGLYSKNPKEVIRLKRLSNKYSKIELNIKIAEYDNLKDIPIN